LIYAAFGSVCSTDVTLLRRLLGIVEGRPDWELVISVSGRIAAVDFSRVPAGVHVFPWVPQTRILRHADVMVTHGGISTIDECVLAGVPVLVYCGFETDMGGNTARVVHHGVGIAGDRRGDGTPVIREHIDRLLCDAGMRANLARLRERYQAYGEHGVAERVIESLLARETHERAVERSASPATRGTDA
jgi:UDP:flavonoid glycosyltransferase YjiC (YdhE family)